MIFILFRISYEILFSFVISGKYSYIMLPEDFTIGKYLISWVAFLLIVPLLIKYIRIFSFSGGVILVFSLLYYIPGTVYYAYRDVPGTYFLLFILHWLFIITFNNLLHKIKLPQLKVRLSSKVYSLITVVVFLFTVFISWRYNNFQITLSLDDVYDLRAYQAQINLPTIVGYFQQFASRFLPFAALFSLYKKNYKLFIGSIFGQILLFSFGGMKTTLFLIPVSVIAYFVIKKVWKTDLGWILYGFLALNVLALLEYAFLSSYNVTSYFQVRSMLTPNRISVFYYDFFSNNEIDFFRQSFLRYFSFESPYEVPISRMIATIYDGSNASHNNGLLGDVFMNFGILGVIIQPFLWSIAFRLMDSVTKEFANEVVIALVISYGMTIINMSIIGVMFTGGYIAMLVVLMIIRNNTNYNNSLYFGTNIQNAVKK